MKSFTYFQPTEIRFGSGSTNDIATIVKRYGTRCLVVSTEAGDKLPDRFKRVIMLLRENNIEVLHFDGIIPNPTTDVITKGAKQANEFRADVIIGLGGGSSMDSAKAIAVEATHEGTAWDYRWFSSTQPTKATLPVIAVATTAGTGSEVTQVAVLTNSSEQDKSAIYNNHIYPKVAIIDPELMLSVPVSVTAQTGFDAFTHAFESYLHPNASPYTNMLALKSMSLVATHLPQAVRNGSDLEAREGLALASTLAGLCIANAGVTLPHGIGMTISGVCPQVSHGQALAVIYPEFTRYTYPYAQKQFAEMGRIFAPSLNSQSDEVASEKSCELLDDFMKEIDLWISLEGLGVSKEETILIADRSQVLPDYKNNPRVATRDEILELLMNSYQRPQV